ncbi:MAG: nitroreductase family protein [Bacteroidetes bacterium]|nr:nitroreductase family protein [Bacteroidota bacterium]
MPSLTELICTRQSVRRFSGDPVEKEKLNECLEALRLAPSACNSQPWKVIVVDEPGLKDRVARATYGAAIAFNKFVVQAPVIIVIVMEKPKMITQIGGRIKDKEYPLIDIGAAAVHFCLMATELGLGTCMLGWFREKEIIELLGIPGKKRIGLLIAIGYTKKGYKLRKKIRKKMDDIVSYNRY